jgi:thymidylate synthase (FAD)
MRIIKPNHEILSPIDGEQILKHIELCGRVCYKSEYKITEDSARKLSPTLSNEGMRASLNTQALPCDLSAIGECPHEIVRHRIASYSQESTRYCNYSSDKSEDGLVFIKPYFFENDGFQWEAWYAAMSQAEHQYNYLIQAGATPQEARSVLPNSIKTELICSMNLREWRHFFKLRTAKAAHPQMREIAIPLLNEMKEKIPVVFDDIEVDE